MPRKTIITTIRLAESDDEALREVSAELGLDMANTIRLLVHEKRRALQRAKAKARKQSADAS